MRKGYRPNVGIIIANTKGKLLYCKRRRSNNWQFPQGGIDRNETPEQAAFRELFEEVGIKKHNVKNHIVTIDDADLLGQKQYKDGNVVCDYSDITRDRVEKLLSEINSNFSVSYPSPFGQLIVVSLENVKDEREIIKSNNWWNE